MKTLLIVLACAIALATQTAPVAAQGCGIMPIKPIPPVGCKDLVAECICTSTTNCHYEWRCVK